MREAEAIEKARFAPGEAIWNKARRANEEVRRIRAARFAVLFIGATIRPCAWAEFLQVSDRHPGCKL